MDVKEKKRKERESDKKKMFACVCFLFMLLNYKKKGQKELIVNLNMVKYLKDK